MEEEFFVRHRPSAVEFLGKKSVHAPVARHQCSSCHPAIEDPKKLSKPAKELCISCHGDVGKEIKGKHVHSILESGDCSQCHDPHGSDFPFMMSDEVNAVCSTCHAVGEDPIRKSHGGIVVKSVRCTDCHSPHGSDLEKMIHGERLHVPFEQKTCEMCHAPADADGNMQLAGEGTKICLSCHSDLQETLAAKVAHPPAKTGKCWACHNPHTSWRTNRVFLKDRPERVCRTCHSMVPDIGHPLVKHPTWKKGIGNPQDPTKPFDCAACHAPHGSEFERLRRWEAAEFCFKCHPQ